MHRLLGGLVGVVLLVGPGASADDATDWIVVRVVAGPTGAFDIEGQLTAGGTVRGGDAALVGIGFADRWVSTVDIAPIGAGPIRLSTTEGAGSVDLVVQEGPDPRRLIIDTGVSYEGELDAGTSFSLLVFTPGMHLDAIAVAPPVVGAGDVSVSVYQGSGSRAITASDPGDAGIGVGAGPGAAAAEQVHEATLQQGVVGGFVTAGFCTICQGTWESPGETGSISTIDAVGASTVTGRSIFAGPGGTWRWTWSGVGINRALAPAGRVPAFAAYAPLGDAWILFHGFAL